MSAHLDWHDDAQSIIVCRLRGDFDVATYGVMEGQLPMLAREVDHRVDVIFYLESGANLPPLRGFLQEIGILGNVMPPNFGVFIGVGEGWLLSNPVSVAIGSVFARRYFTSGRVLVAPALDAAVRRVLSLRV